MELKSNRHNKRNRGLRPGASVLSGFRHLPGVVRIDRQGERLQAQVRFGMVVGNVIDASGNQSLGANVTLTNLGTNEMRTVKTGNAGTYSFPNISPGKYRVDVEQAGFKRFMAVMMFRYLSM